MVTYIDASNALKYQILFEKAVEALQNHQSEIPQSERDTLSITSLDDYYAYLPYLMKFRLNDTEDEDVHRFFAKVPLDEDYFKIDADARSIAVPAAFQRNGVGVQGDEIAEVVYFSIDRYFDSVDLASVDNIVIQWQTRNGTGISQHFGKSIEVIDGKEKIVFGWPISSALTGSAGTIRFAVRFYSVDVNEQVIKYSLTTLPAEVTINATLDYDLFDNTIKEPSQSDLITSRIRSAGVYNTEIPVPGVPYITVPLHVDGLPAAANIVDLPVDNQTGELGSLKLIVGAMPSTIGNIGYEWQKFAYQNGDYSAESSGYTGQVSLDYEPVIGELYSDRIYYTLSGEPVVATVLEDTSSTSVDPESGYTTTPGGSVIYERVSTAIVDSVGIYTVDVTARNKVNTTTAKMAAVDGIKIPGPETPVIEFADSELVSDNVAHIISDDGANVSLETVVRAGEFDAEGHVLAGMGNNPDVKLSYVWKQKLDEDTIVPVVGNVPGSIALHILPVAQTPGDSNVAKAKYNQGHVMLVQDDDTVHIYKTDENALEAYTSSDVYQAELGDKEWIAIDIDTGFDSIVGHRWGNKPEDQQYTLTQYDADEASGLGLGDGHIIFWTHTDDLSEGLTIKIDDHTLQLTYSATPLADLTYTFSADNKVMTISGLDSANIDQTYVVEVTAKRNGIETKATSGEYRVTNSPIAPSILVRNANGQWQEVEFDENNPALSGIYHKRVLGQPNTLVFRISDEKHDELSYIWMRARIDADETQLAVDIDNNLPGLFEDKTGEGDYPMTESGEFRLEAIPASMGSVEEDAPNAPTYTLDSDSPSGYYYCIVVNKLNGHLKASVTPFFNVQD